MYHRCRLDLGERCYECVPTTRIEQVCFWVGVTIFVTVIVVRGF